MARSRGTNFDNLRSFAIARFGAEGWERVLQTLPASDRATLGGIVAVGWYDLALHVRLFRAIDGALGRSDGALLRDFGRYDAERDLTGIHRLFLRLANPAYVLEKAGEYWSRFYDVGSWRIEREPQGAVGTLRDFDPLDELFCIATNSYVERMFQLVGARGATSDHCRCRTRGDDVCAYAIRW